jgi:UDP-N-acetylmuramate--alanine ligase
VIDKNLNIDNTGFLQQMRKQKEELAAMLVEQSIKRFHFIGIGGSGMSGIAQMCLENGFLVSGSDLNPSPITNRLKGYGAEIHFPHCKDSVLEDSIVVVSSAIPETNEELSYAREKGMIVKKRAEVLAWLMQERNGISVAGTHGKTTTTSMISSILTSAGVDPSTVVGGEANHVGGNAKFGNGDLLVAEADESDGSFLLLPTKYAVVTNIDNDHLGHYGSFEQLCNSFHNFMEETEEFVIACGEDENLQKTIKMVSTDVFTYGRGDGFDYGISNVDLMPDKTTFSVSKQGKHLVDVVLSVPGLHNVLNATASVALCDQLGISAEYLRQGLMDFTGVQRRLELVAESNDIRVYDDYAHHPTEIQAVIECGKEMVKSTGGKLVVCFQPHRYSRVKDLHQEFALSLTGADFLYLAPVYAAGEKPMPGYDSWTIKKSLKLEPLSYQMLSDNMDEWAGLIKQELQPGDVFMTLGAGNITRLGRDLF